MAPNGIPIASRVRGEIIAHSVVTVIVLFVVGLRLLGRVRGIGLGWDDGLVVLATLMGITLLVMEGVWARLGEGHDLLPSDPYYLQVASNTPRILQMLFGFSLLYIQALATIKCSALAFYLRMFPGRKMQLVIKLSLAMTVVWVVGHDLAAIFLCHPVRYQWDRTVPASENPKCGDSTKFYTSVVTTNILSDLWIMGIPMYTIWSLKMRTPEKIALTVCFLLGLSTVALSIARLANVYKIAVSTNLTGTMDTAVLLGILEIDFGILAIRRVALTIPCSHDAPAMSDDDFYNSIPLLRPFYTRYKQKMSTSRPERSDYERSGYRLNGTSKAQSKLKSSNKSYTDEAWDMNDYAKSKAQKPSYMENSIEVVTGDGSSEERLTSPSHMPASQIAVRTDWTISRD